ncbi:hypothetical protein M0P65_07895 [Candidatus Gracilibacteria bacterium]|jgi:hypothetical protein|nr:hypothetical protein [Candidatus Gracilibacteria bacterium]
MSQKLEDQYDMDYWIDLIFRKPINEKSSPKTEEDLNNGFTLKFFNHNLNGSENKEKYGTLYKDDHQISTEVFRVGGNCAGFKDGYCVLIHYKIRSDDPKHNSYDFGTHVIVNELGEIRLKANTIMEYPYHIGGIVGCLKNSYYNLETGEIILDGTFSLGKKYVKKNILKSSKYIFIEIKDNQKDYVYQIELLTGKIKIYE